jgi:predicted RNA-binding protein with PUA-like domain
MNYWLVKSEPEAYSWAQFVKDRGTAWTGVRNFAARNHLRGMKKGDLVFYYHSGDEKIRRWPGARGKGILSGPNRGRG